MKVNLDEVIETVKGKLDSTNIILTGLEEEEKEFASILHGTGLVNHDTIKDILVYGSCISGNKKLKQAKRAKIQCYSLEEFKNEFLYNHNAKNAFDGKTVLVDINLDYKSIMPIYLLNPKAVIWSNQVNKRRVQEVDFVISNEENLDHIKNGLGEWLQDIEFEQLSLHGQTIEPYFSKYQRKQISH
jgi:hypothetical protein